MEMWVLTGHHKQCLWCAWPSCSGPDSVLDPSRTSHHHHSGSIPDLVLFQVASTKVSKVSLSKFSCSPWVSACEWTLTAYSCANSPSLTSQFASLLGPLPHNVKCLRQTCNQKTFYIANACTQQDIWMFMSSYMISSFFVPGFAACAFLFKKQTQEDLREDNKTIPQYRPGTGRRFCFVLFLKLFCLRHCLVQWQGES